MSKLALSYLAMLIAAGCIFGGCEPLSEHDDDDIVNPGEVPPPYESENIDSIYIPDAELRKLLYSQKIAKPIDDKAGWVAKADKNELNLTEGPDYTLSEIHSTEGLEALNLSSLMIDGALRISNLKIDSWLYLQYLTVENAPAINSLFMTNCPELEEITIKENIETVTVSELKSKNTFEGNRIGEWNASHIVINDWDEINDIIIDDNRSVSTVTIDGCDKLTAISISDCRNLTKLTVTESHILRNVDIKDCRKLTKLLDIKSREMLENLSVFGCPLEQIDITNAPNLNNLNISGGEFLSDEAEREFNTEQNKYSWFIDPRPYCVSSSLPNLLKLDLTGSDAIEYLQISPNRASLQITGNLDNAVDIMGRYSNITSIPDLDTEKIECIDLTGNNLTDFNLPKRHITQVYLKFNDITKEFPKKFGAYTYFQYDRRYEYWTDNEGNTRHTDNGKGWWYHYEPNDTPPTGF